MREGVREGGWVGGWVGDSYCYYSATFSLQLNLILLLIQTYGTMWEVGLAWS